MRAQLQSFIADFLARRQLDDADGFALSAARALENIDSWSEDAVVETLAGVRTDLFRRNRGDRKQDVLRELASRLVSRFSQSRPGDKDECNILVFAANPPGSNRLQIDEEVREIVTKIRGSKHRERIQLIGAWAARPDDLIQYLNETPATVVHFSGHGGGVSGLVFARDDGSEALVSASALDQLFGAMSGQIRLVVLNACYSDAQAASIVKHVDCVIGMQNAISDEAAAVFAASLYRAIGFGKSVQEAFEQGKAALMLEEIHEEQTPILLSRKGVDPAAVTLLR